MKLAIMFCNMPMVEIRDIPDSIDDVEGYIEDDLGYDASEVSWQCYDDKELKVIVC